MTQFTKGTVLWGRPPSLQVGTVMMFCAVVWPCTECGVWLVVVCNWVSKTREEKHLQAMIKAGVIGPSTSEWAAPVVLVRKKDGWVRWCVDYHCLNSVTMKDAYPLPKIKECLDVLGGASMFSTLDLQSGYWQVGPLWMHSIPNIQQQEQICSCHYWPVHQMGGSLPCSRSRGPRWRPGGLCMTSHLTGWCSEERFINRRISAQGLQSWNQTDNASWPVEALRQWCDSSLGPAHTEPSASAA